MTLLTHPFLLVCKPQFPQFNQLGLAHISYPTKHEQSILCILHTSIYIEIPLDFNRFMVYILGAPKYPRLRQRWGSTRSRQRPTCQLAKQETAVGEYFPASPSNFQLSYILLWCLHMQSCDLHSKPRRLTPSHSSVLSCPLSESIRRLHPIYPILGSKWRWDKPFSFAQNIWKAPTDESRSSRRYSRIAVKESKTSFASILAAASFSEFSPPERHSHKDSSPEMDFRMVAENCGFATSWEPLLLSNGAQKFQEDFVPAQAERVKSQGPFSWSSQRDNLFWQVRTSQTNGAHDLSLCRIRLN